VCYIFNDGITSCNIGEKLNINNVLSLALQDSSGNQVTLKATDTTTPYTFSFPTTAGSNNQVLQTDGTGKTSWATNNNQLYQFVWVTSNSSATTSTSYIPTSLQATITPSNTSHHILVLVFGDASLVSTTLNLFATITLFRGNTDLGANVRGLQQMWNVVSSANSQLVYPCSFSYVDNPNTTSAVTYTVEEKVSNSSLSVSWGQGNAGSLLPMIILAEIN
jgi:hypothetical protein